MRSSFDIYMARRLSTSGETRRNSPGIAIGTAGVCLAFVIMLISLSVVIGFKREIRSKIFGFEAPLAIQAPAGIPGEGIRTIEITEDMRREIERLLPGCAMAGVVDEQALLKTDSAFAAINLRCVEPSFDFSLISGSLTEGTMAPEGPGEGEIVISQSTASALGLHTGDRVFTHFLGAGNILTRRYTIAAVYDTHFHEYDKNMAYGAIDIARDLNVADTDRFTSLRITGIDPEKVDESRRLLGDMLVERAIASRDGGFEMPDVVDVYSRGAIYFNWLELLDTNVVVIIILMSLVSGFTLVSCLFILILERINFIGLLKSLGCRDSNIRSIFILITEKIVVRGLLWGNLIGVGLILIQHFFRIIPLDPESYYLNYVPTSLDPLPWIVLNLAVVVLAYAVLVLPSMAISSLSPVDSMRYNDGTAK